VILLNHIVHIFAGADSNGFAPCRSRFSALHCKIALPFVCLPPIVIRSGLHVELNRIAVAFDRTIQLQPLAFDLDVTFIKVPFAGDLTLLPIETFKQFRTDTNAPAMPSGMVQIAAAFRHHLLEIAHAQIIS